MSDSDYNSYTFMYTEQRAPRIRTRKNLCDNTYSQFHLKYDKKGEKTRNKELKRNKVEKV